MHPYRVPMRDAVLEFLAFGLKQVRACLFVGLFFAAVFSMPRGGAFVVPLLNVPDWAAEKRRLLAAVPGLELVEGLVSISVVGDGFAATGEPLARFVRALRDADIAITHLNATPLRVSALVEPRASAEAQKRIHAAFVP